MIFQFSVAHRSRMKAVVSLLALLSLTWAQEQPRYSCPEYDVDFDGNDLEVIENVESWEDCGKTLLDRHYRLGLWK